MRFLPWALALSLLSGCSFFAEDLTWSAEEGDASSAPAFDAEASAPDASMANDATVTLPDDAGVPDADSDLPDGGSDLPDAKAIPADAQADPPDATAPGLDAAAPLADAASEVQTDIVTMNDRDAPNHAAFSSWPNNKVRFKGVVVSPVFRDARSVAGTDPTSWYCRMGVYLADPNAASPEHNGILVLSKSSVLLADAGTPMAGNCAQDSPLEKARIADAGLVIGEELEVVGYFAEDCYRTTLTGPDGGMGPCDNSDESGRDLARATVQANVSGSIVRTGLTPGVPSNLPVTVNIDDIASGARTGTSPNYVSQVGPKWFDFRQVLVRLQNVKVVNDTLPSCNFAVQTPDGTSGMLTVIDDILFVSSTCPSRPGASTTLSSLTGFATWYVSSMTAETQLAPRSDSDIVP